LADSAAFQTLAEFGIALAGFTSIVVVFRRGGEQLHPADHFRVFSALVPSLVGAFLALVPVGIDLLGLPPATMWRVASIVLAGAAFSLLATTTIQLRRLPPEASALLSRPIGIFLRILGALSAVGGLANATAAFAPPQGGLYFFAVLLLLITGAIVFVRIVFIRPTV
jgi:hypothetical protein